MQSDISVFQAPAGSKIRVAKIHGEPWFMAADVCRALNLDLSSGTNPHLTKVAADEKQLVRAKDLPKGALGTAPSAMTVSESGLYKLVLRSDKAQARAFQDWVTREVLPAIRKDGGYILGEEKVRTGEMSEDELVLKALNVLQAKVQRLTRERDDALRELQMVTVDEYRALTHRYMQHGEKTRLGKLAARLAAERGIALERQHRSFVDVWGTRRDVFVNVYPRHLLEEAESHFSSMMLAA